MRRSLQSLGARMAAWSPRVVDTVLAAGLLAAAVVEGALAGASAPARIAAIALAALTAAGVAIRRPRPLLALVLGLAAITLLNLLPDPVRDGTRGLFFGLLFLVYSMALRTAVRRLVLGVGLTLAGVALAIATAPDPGFADAVFAAMLVIAAPLAAGRLLQARIGLNEALAVKAQRLDEQRGARADEAVASERARIAGELHDVVAHALGAMTVQAAGARRMAACDSDAAGAALAGIESTGREALAELRRLVGVLRAEDDATELEPQPSLASIADLVARARSAGLPVELSIEGERHGLTAGIDLTGYRIVQEALAEALRDGGAARADVLVRYRSGAVEIEVRDDGARGHRRLLGMRERVRVYGGQLETGPRRGGGHLVRARLPLEPAT